MFVHVLADTSDKLSELCFILERKFSVAGERLDALAKLPHTPLAVVVRADLRGVANIAALKKRAARLANVKKRIFLVEQPSHVCISQAYALGATHVLAGAIDQTKLVAALIGPAESQASSQSEAPQPLSVSRSTSRAQARPAARSPIASPSMGCPNGLRRCDVITRGPTSTASS